MKGPLGATIATLHGLGWKPISPGLWRNPSETEEAILSYKCYEIEDIAQTVAETADEKAWKDAASHHLGGGLEKGPPSMCPAKAARKKLVKEQQWEQVAALDAVVCGGCMHHGR